MARTSFRVWTDPTLGRLLSSKLLSAMATGVFLGSLPLAVAAEGGSPFEVGLTSAALFAWWVVSIPLSVLTDRHGAGPVLRLIAPMRVGALGLIAAHVLFGGQIGVAVIVAGALIYGLVNVVGDTASTTLPALVMDEGRYDHAYSSLQAVTLMADLVIGPSAGALLFGAAGWLPFVVAGVVLFGSWLILIPFFGDPRTQPTLDPNTEGGWWTDTLGGMRHVLRAPFIRGIAITLVGIAAAEEIVAVTVAPYVRDGSGTLRWPQTLGVVRGAAGVLAVVAALMVGSAAGKLGREPVMAVVAFTGALSAAVLAIGPRWPAVFAAIAISAVAEAMWVPLAQAAIMRQTPRHLMGRTRAAVMFLTWGTLPLTSVIGGGLATTLGIRPILLIGSALALASCSLGVPMFLRSRNTTADSGTKSN